MTRIVAVTSGKDGVGKTHLSISLALQCARKGLRTCLFDTDPGANAAALLGLTPERSLQDVISGACHLRDILISSNGIDILAGGSGIAAIGELPSPETHRLAQAFSGLAQYDLVIFDGSFGSTDNTLEFAAAIPELLLVVTPEPSALTDAYAMVKLLRRRHYAGHLQVIVNQVHSERQAQHTFEKFREVVRVYQGLDLPLLGAIPFDKRIPAAAIARSVAPLREAGSLSELAMAALAEQMLMTAPDTALHDPLHAFWLQLTGEELPAAEALPEMTAESLPEMIAVDSPVSAPSPVPHSTDSDLSTELSERLTRLEIGMGAVLEELLARRENSAPDTVSAQPSGRQVAPAAPVPDRRESRRNSDSAAPARFVRNAQRATPIDALQLRRVVGRMLIKAMPLDDSSNEEPVRIAVDQIQLDGSNDFSLRPGRYTRISLHCHHIRKPDSFVEEIFSNCAISGCKVRHLGSQVRYWVTSGRDGCILLDGDDSDRNCVQVYMAAGGNSLLETESVEPEAVASLRRITEGSPAVDATPAQLLGKFPHQRLLVEDGAGDSQEIFRLLRRDRSPLLCAFLQADGVSAAGHLCERSP